MLSWLFFVCLLVGADSLFDYREETPSRNIKEGQLTDTLAHIVNHHRFRRDAELDSSFSEEEESSQEDSDDNSATSSSQSAILKQDSEHDSDAEDDEKSQAVNGTGNVKMVSERTVIIKTQAEKSGYGESDLEEDGPIVNKFNTETKSGDKGSDAAPNLDKTATKEERGNNSTGKLSGSPQSQRVSVKPSMQLIGIVVGVVLSSVFITGFIRWRVKKHLYAKRLRKLAQMEKYSTFKNMVQQQAGLMDTIYEGEETHDSPAQHASASGAFRVRKQSQARPWRSRWSCLRFILCGETQKKRVSMREESYRFSPSRRTGLNRMVVKEWDISVPRLPPPHNESFPGHNLPDRRRDDHHFNAVSIPLLHQDTGHGDTQLNHAISHSSSVSTPPSSSSSSLAPPSLAPVRRSPSPGRTVMSSVLNTVFSFHRDWVGRRWLERHNLSISGILHGNGNSSQAQLERNIAEIAQSSEEGISESQVSTSMTSTEADMTTQLSDDCRDSAYSLNSFHTVNSHVDGQMPELYYTNDADENANFTSYSNNVNVSSHDTHEASSMTSFSTLGVNASYMLQNQTQPKYSQSRAPTPVDLRNPIRQLSPLPTEYNLNVSTNGGRFRSFSLPVTNLLFDPGRVNSSQHSPQSPVGSANDIQYSDSQYYLSSPMSDEFSHRSGVVLEHLADGSKIIFVPPPFLPSYHNDKPPPYQ